MFKYYYVLKTPGTKLHVGPSLLWNLELEILTAVIDDCENDDCEYDDLKNQEHENNICENYDCENDFCEND